jgi:hypothetical protein
MVYNAVPVSYNYDTVQSVSGTMNTLSITFSDGYIFMDASTTPLSPNIQFVHEQIQTASPFTVYASNNFNFDLVKGGTFNCNIMAVVINGTATTLANNGANTDCVATITAPAVGSYSYKIRYLLTLYEYDLTSSNVVTQLTSITLPTITAMSPAITPSTSTNYAFTFSSAYISNIVKAVFTPATGGFSAITVVNPPDIINNQAGVTCTINNVTATVGGNWGVVLTDSNGLTFSYNTSLTFWTISSYTPTIVDGTGLATFNIVITFTANVTSAQITSVKLHHSDGATIATTTSRSYLGTNLTATFNTGIKPGYYTLKVTDVNANVYTNAVQFYYDWIISSFTPLYYAVNTQISTLKLNFSHDPTGQISTIRLLNGAALVDTLTAGAVTGTQMAATSTAAGEVSGQYTISITDINGIVTTTTTKLTIFDINATSFLTTSLLTTATTSNYSFVIPFTTTINLATITKATITLTGGGGTINTNSFTVAGSNLTVTWPGTIPGGKYNLVLTDLNANTLTTTNQLISKQAVSTVTEIEYPANVALSLTITYANTVTAADISSVIVYDSFNLPTTLPSAGWTFVGAVLTATLAAGLPVSTYTLKSTDINAQIFTYGTQIKVYDVTAINPSILNASTAIAGTTLQVVMSNATLTTTWTAKLVSVSSGAKTAMGYTTAGANIYLTNGAGLPTDTYKVELTNQWNVALTSTQTIYFGFGIASVTQAATQVNNAISFTLTFSSALGVNPSTTISKVTITDSANTVYTTTLGVAAGATLTCTYAGLAVGSYYTIKAYDSNVPANVMTHATKQSVFMSITSTSLTQITTNTAIAMNVVFDQALSTGDPHTLVATMVLKDTINNVTYPVTMGTITGNTMAITAAAIAVPSNYQIVCTDSATTPNTFNSPNIQITMGITGYASTYFEQGKPISILITMDTTLGGSVYKTISKVSLYDINAPAVPIAMALAAPAGNTIRASIVAGMTTLSSYTVAVYDNAGAPNRINAAKLLQITMSVTQTVTDIFVVGDTWTSVATFSSTINAANAFTNITGMYLYSIFCGVMPLSVISSTGATVTYRSTGVTKADLYQLRAIDGNGNTIFSSFWVTITLYIVNYSPQLYPAATLMNLDVQFNEVLNTGARNIVTINRVVLSNSSDNVLIQYNTMKQPDTMRCTNVVPNYGDYNVNAYDLYNNKISLKTPILIRITMGLISFDKEVSDQYFPLNLNITFSHNVGNNNNFERINQLKLRNTKTSQDTVISIISTNGPKMVVQHEPGIPTVGSYTIVAVDGFGNEVLMPKPIYIIPKNTCLQDDAAVTYVTPLLAGVYAYNGRCAKSCPTGYLPDVNNLCTDTTPDTTKILDDKQVVTNCPSGYILEGKNCVSCLSKGLYYSNYKCITACPDSLGYKTSGECVSCVLEDLLLDDIRCVSQCSVLKVNKSGVCTPCPVKQAWYQFTCVDVCPTGTYRTAQNSCDPDYNIIPPVYSRKCGVGTCNQGNCVEYIQHAECNCPGSTYGQYCDHSMEQIPATMQYYSNIIEDMLAASNNSTLVSYLTTSQLLDMVKMFEQLPDLFDKYPKILDNLQQIILTQLSLMSKDTIVIDPNIFLFADEVVDLNIYRYKSEKTFSDDVNKKLQKNIGDIKTGMELVADLITMRIDKYLTNSTSTNLNLGGKRVQVQIGYNNNDLTTTADKYKISIFNNLGDIEKNVGSKIKIKKIDYKPETTLSIISRFRLLQQTTSSDISQLGSATLPSTTATTNTGLNLGDIATTLNNSALINPNNTTLGQTTATATSTEITTSYETANDVKFNIYLSASAEPLNMNNLLGSGGVKLNMTVPISGMSTDKYNKYKIYSAEGIEIYDPNAVAFTNVCFGFIDPITGFDTTINFRRQNYYNGLTASCGLNCQYIGITDDNRMVCSCSPAAVEANADFTPNAISDLSDINLDLIKCTEKTIDNIGTNKALYVIITIIGIAIISTLGLFLYDLHIIKKHLHELIRSDGHFFNKSMGAAAYFKVEEIEENIPSNSQANGNNGNRNSNGDNGVDFNNFNQGDNGSLGNSNHENIAGSNNNSNNNLNNNNEGGNPDIEINTDSNNNQANTNVEMVNGPRAVGKPPRPDSRQQDSNLILRDNKNEDNSSEDHPGTEIVDEMRDQVMNQINNNLILLINKLGEDGVELKKKKKVKSAKIQPLTARYEQHPYDNEELNIIDEEQDHQYKKGKLNQTEIDEVKFNPYMNNKDYSQVVINSENSDGKYHIVKKKTKVIDPILHPDLMDIKPNKELFMNDHERVIPINDYEVLKTDEMIKYDKRSYFRYIFDFLMTYHILFSLFRRSLLYPYHVRAMLLVLAISAEFAFNAFFYSDTYINFKAQQTQQVRVRIINNIRIISSIHWNLNSVKLSVLL